MLPIGGNWVGSWALTTVGLIWQAWLLAVPFQLLLGQRDNAVRATRCRGRPTAANRPPMAADDDDAPRTMQAFVAELDRHREAKGWSQRELARRAGCNPSALARLRRPGRGMGPQLAAKLFAV